MFETTVLFECRSISRLELIAKSVSTVISVRREPDVMTQHLVSGVIVTQLAAQEFV